MGIRYEESVAVLEGSCGIRDVESLEEFFKAHKEQAEVSLAVCSKMHTAIFQVLRKRRAVIIDAPNDPFITRWLCPFLGERSGSMAGEVENNNSGE